MSWNNVKEVVVSLYSNSKDIVFVTDHNFKIIWQNKNSDNMRDINLKESLGNVNADNIESGDSYILINGKEFPCKLINYQQEEIVIIMISSQDALDWLMSCSTIRNYIEDKSAIIRQAVCEITNINNLIDAYFNENFIYDQKENLNLSIKSCFKLLRTVSCMSEISNYYGDSDYFISSDTINLNEFLEKFIYNCKSNLRNINPQIDLKVSEHPLFVLADNERLTCCLLSILTSVLKKFGINGDCDVNVLDKEQFVEIKIEFIKVSEKDDINHLEILSSHKVIDCFCKKYEAEFETQENEKSIVCQLKLKKADDVLTFSSISNNLLVSTKFSRTSIVLSEFVDFKFY